MQGGSDEDQEVELEALRSIFGEDFLDLEPVWSCTTFAILLRSSSGSTPGAVQGKLIVTLPKNYPKQR